MEEVIPPFRSEFLTYRDATMRDPNLSPEEKAARVKSKYQQIERDFLALRTKAYKAFYSRAAVEHSCANNGVGTKSCPAVDAEKGIYKCVAAPDSGLYVRDAWIAFFRGNRNAGWSAVREFRN